MLIAFKLNWWSVAMLPGPEPCRLELCCMPSLRTSIFLSDRRQQNCAKIMPEYRCVCICTYICTYVHDAVFLDTWDGYVYTINIYMYIRCIYIYIRYIYIYIYIYIKRERERKWLGYGYGYTHRIENTRRQLKNRLFPSNCYVSFRRVKKYLPIWFEFKMTLL